MLCLLLVNPACFFISVQIVSRIGEGRARWTTQLYNENNYLFDTDNRTQWKNYLRKFSRLRFHLRLMVIETSVQHFLFFPGRSISPHPWGEMVSGMGRDGLGVHLAPWKCMELYCQYCAMCDTERNGLNNGERSMHAGTLCTDIRKLFFFKF